VTANQSRVPQARLRASPDRFGVAALSVCESLILALKERGILDDAEIHGLLEDVSSAHRNAAADGDDPDLHESVAEIADEIMNGGNSVRLLRRPGRNSTARLP
jgi:hypothetical protein